MILAGGRGTRLAPYTAVLPKPLVPLGNYPIVEILVRQLVSQGFDRLVFSVGHLAGLLEAYFRDHSVRRRHTEVDISWVREEEPLGTAGPLRLMDDLPDSFLVLNGDLFTTADFARLLDRHSASGAELTIAARRKDVRLQLGVVVHDDGKVVDYVEKPSYGFDVSMGMYAYSRSALDLIERGSRMDFPDLVLALVSAGRSVRCAMPDCQWLDIGNPDDYAQAQRLFEEAPDRYLPPLA